MKTILNLVACCCIASLAAGFNLEDFERVIGQPCLTRIFNPNYQQMGGIRPLGRSMESFISMVEKIERNHTSWTIYQVAKTIIKRFGFDGMKYQMLSGKIEHQQDVHYVRRRTIIDKLIDFSQFEEFNENDLTEEEKCAMFYMVGHLVNNTIRTGIDEATTFNAHVHTSGDQTDIRETTVAKHPREQGVVSLYSNEHQAIALGKVLLGVVAAETVQSKTIGEMFPDYVKSNPKFPKEKVIDSLIGVTLADVVAHGVVTKDEGNNLYGNGGRWNSTVCSNDYILQETSPGSTLAVLRGAIDGLLIGKALREMPSGAGRDITLSKILRMYYDPRGIVSDSPGNARTYCRRQEYSTVDGELLQSSIQGFYHAYIALHQNGAKVDAEGDSKSSNGLAAIQGVMGMIDVNDGRCHRQKEDKCESTSNVFVVLDGDEKGTNGFDFQERTLSQLSTKLDIGFGAGSIGLYFNSREGNTNLQPLIENSTNPVLPACLTSWLGDSRIPQSVDEESLLQSLNSTLQNFENRNAEESKANSKVVIIFKFSGLKQTEQNRVTTAASLVRNGHRDTRVITVGNDQATLQLLATDAQDVITGINEPNNLADKLAEKICNVPSVFQYDQCWNTRNRKEEDNHASGYITPDYTQYWAMYPQYFLKTYNAELKFKTEGLNGDIRVCFSRSNPNPKEGSTTDRYMECQTTKSEAPEVTFHLKNPCHRYHVYNCPPAFFSVTGVSNNNNRARCQDTECRRTDQIKFTFSHKGISCNGSFQLLSSGLSGILLLVALVYPFLTKTY